MSEKVEYKYEGVGKTFNEIVEMNIGNLGKMFFDFGYSYLLVLSNGEKIQCTGALELSECDKWLTVSVYEPEPILTGKTTKGIYGQEYKEEFRPRDKVTINVDHIIAIYGHVS